MPRAIAEAATSLGEGRCAFRALQNALYFLFVLLFFCFVFVCVRFFFAASVGGRLFILFGFGWRVALFFSGWGVGENDERIMFVLFFGGECLGVVFKVGVLLVWVEVFVNYNWVLDEKRSRWMERQYQHLACQLEKGQESQVASDVSSYKDIIISLLFHSCLFVDPKKPVGHRNMAPQPFT